MLICSRSGFSESSVHHFCNLHNIRKPSSTFLNMILKESVEEVNTHLPVCAQQLQCMHGVYGAGWAYVWSKNAQGSAGVEGARISEGRVAAALQRVASEQNERWRHDTIDRPNPSPYIAFYFGHRIHIN